MIRPLEVFIGLRYTKAKRRNHFISFISFTSMAGIALGVAALITVLSVMNGFGQELRDRILGVVSHATVLQAGGHLKDWQALQKKLTTHKDIIGVAPYVKGQGMLVNGQRTSGILVRGIEPQLEPAVSNVTSKLVEGDLASLKAGSFGIVIGQALSWKLNVQVGEPVSLMIPQALATPAGMLPRFKRFKVVGIFDVGMYQYDSGLALIHIKDAAILYSMGKSVSGLRLKLDDLYMAPKVALDLENELGAPYYTQNWTKEHANFFRALKIEKRVMLVILLLIVAVAAFNIVSTLVMVVTDKRADIAILRTLGLSPSSVMGIFMVQGTLIGVIGTLFGVVSGIVLAINVEAAVHFVEQLFGFTILAADVYYITDLPSDIHTADVVTIAVTSLIMGTIATVYPAWRASKVQPAEALRYE